jgi:hypothetical protein
MANCVPLPIALAVSAEIVRKKEAIEGEKYDVHSYTNRVHALGRFRKTFTRHFPELSQPGTVLSRTPSGTDPTGRRRSEQLTMFRITTQTCRAFTLTEVLIMAAMNMENARLASDVTPVSSSVTGVLIPESNPGDIQTFSKQLA